MIWCKLIGHKFSVWHSSKDCETQERICYRCDFRETIKTEYFPLYNCSEGRHTWTKWNVGNLYQDRYCLKCGFGEYIRTKRHK